MKLRNKICLLCLFATCSAYGQVDSTQVDTTMMVEPMEEMMIREMDEPVMYDIAETPAASDYIEYNPLNKFRHSKKIKTEEKPDKKAIYSQGTGELLKQIADNLNVPYGYGGEDKYVILQFVVGKDSVLYNPEVLFSPGTEHSINATNVIEQLQDRFVPATKNGKPVDTIITIPIRFEQRSSHEYRYRNRYR